VWISTKYQSTNPKQIPINEIQNFKQDCFGHLELVLGIYLEVGIWLPGGRQGY
jgi:hypothetical protein